jgi:hypothetical protein
MFVDKTNKSCKNLSTCIAVAGCDRDWDEAELGRSGIGAMRDWDKAVEAPGGGREAS